MLIRKLVHTELMLAVEMQILAAANWVATASTTVWALVIAGTGSPATSGFSQTFILTRAVRAIGVALRKISVAEIFASLLKILIWASLPEGGSNEKS